MAEDAAELLTHALKLPPAARAAIADSLIDSLDTWGILLVKLETG